MYVYYAYFLCFHLTLMFHFSCARGSPKRQILFQKTGHFQVFEFSGSVCDLYAKSQLFDDMVFGV